MLPACNQRKQKNKQLVTSRSGVSEPHSHPHCKLTPFLFIKFTLLFTSQWTSVCVACVDRFGEGVCGTRTWSYFLLPSLSLTRGRHLFVVFVLTLTKIILPLLGERPPAASVGSNPLLATTLCLLSFHNGWYTLVGGCLGLSH